MTTATKHDSTIRRRKGSQNALFCRLTSVALGAVLFSLMLSAPAVQAAVYESNLYVDANGHTSTITNNPAASASVQNSGSSSFYGPWSSSASANFDWAVGTTGFTVSASGYPSNASAQMSMNDKIYPAWVDNTNNTPLTMQFVFSVTGSYSTSNGNPANFSGWMLYADFFAGIDTPMGANVGFSQYNLASGSRSQTFDLTFNPATDHYIRVYEDMGAWFTPYNGQSATADFSHTGTIQIILPQGATFTSDSGVFLTGPAAIPEPETYAMLLAGLGLLGLAGRRRKQNGA
jgi:hypothetical protein